MNSIRITVATLLVGAVTYAGAAAPSFATDPDPGAPAVIPTPAILPEVAQAPEEVLETAQEVLSGNGEGKDATQVLVDLFQVLPDLEGSDRAAAERLMARPSDNVNAANPTQEPRYADGVVKYAACGVHVCIHFVMAGEHAVLSPAIDGDHDKIPDSVEKTLSYFEISWATEVDALGYRGPHPDGNRGEAFGTTVLEGSRDGKIDIYLAQLNGAFGYAQPEDDGDDNDLTHTAHVVLDADMAGLGCASWVACTQATAAHEFFHVVQFAYDTFEPNWLSESTATWMEEQVFGASNDNRNYLPFSSLRKPHQPLDTENHLAEYGNWIFWEFVTQRKGDAFVRALWSRASLSKYTGLNVLTQTLSDHGWSLPSAFAEFGAVNNAPRIAYPEGRYYQSAEVTRGWTLTRAARSTGWRSTNLARLASRNFVFVPASGMTETNWRVDVNVNGPSSVATTAYALVFFRDGRVVRVPIALDRYGNGTRRMDFSRSRVAKVTINLGNASGADGRVTAFRATAKRI